MNIAPEQAPDGFGSVAWPAGGRVASVPPTGSAKSAWLAIPATTLSPRNVVFLTLLFACLLTVVGVTGYFRLSPETAGLRQTVLESLPARPDKKIALHVGFFTTGLARIGSRFFKLPQEAHAGIESVRSAEVGVYKLHGTAGVDTGTILARADQVMSARRWDRVVGVISAKNELVAVYMPRRGLSSSGMKCCVLVLKDQELVVAGATGNLEPLLEIAQQHIHLDDAVQHFALR